MKVFSTALAILALTVSLVFSGEGTAGPGKSVQDIFVVAPTELDPGSRAAFRVVVKEAKSLLESEPVGDARVEIVLVGPSGKSWQLLSARTDKTGTIDQSARVPQVAADGDYELAVKVKSRLGSAEKRHKVTITPRYRVLLTTDKPLYQPNQLIHIRAVALRTADLAPMAGSEVSLIVEDPQGNKLMKKTGKTDEYGIFAADFQLADEIRLGDYKIAAQVLDKTVEKNVKVDRYVLPDFKVTLTTERDYYKPGDKVTGKVNAWYFFGKPVAGGKVTVTAKTFDYEFHEVAEIKGATDDDGNFSFSLDLPTHFVGQPLEQGDAFVLIEAAVVDKAEHEEKSMAQRTVSAQDLSIELVPEAGDIVPGVENRVFVVVSSPDGRPQRARAKVEVGSRSFFVDTDESGIGVFAFRPEQGEFQGDYGNYSMLLRARAETSAGAAAQVEQTFYLGAIPESTVLLRADHAIYKTGDDMKLTVLSTHRAGAVYLDIIKDRQTVLTDTLELDDGKAGKSVALPQEIFGTLELHAYIIGKDGEIARDTRVVYVEPASDLSISVSLDRETYRPGERAKLLFKVTDKNGRGQAAALGISIVDEAVFAIQEMQPGLLKVYFTLEQDLAVPRYEVHLAPGGLTFQDAIKEEDRDARRDRAMMVLTAGVQNPTRPGWVENPAEARIEKESEKLAAYGHYFTNWATRNQFLAYRDGGWKFAENVTGRMIKDKSIDKDKAVDSFGDLYRPELLTSIDAEYEPGRFAEAMAAYRISAVYKALNQFARENESWVGKLFEGGGAPDLPADIVDQLLKKGQLEAGHAEDPWGYKLLIVKNDGDNQDPFGQITNYLVKSVGPDGKPDTGDDFTNASLAWQSRALQNAGLYFYEEEEQSLLDDVFDWFGFGVMKSERPRGMNGDMAMPEMVFEAAAPAAMGDGPQAMDGGGGGEPVRVRQYFPETLWWEPALIADGSGRAELEIPLADSITTWRLTALGHSRDGLLGSSTSGIRVFQDFFVDIDFPVQLTEGDEVEVPVAVYNYLPGRQSVKLEVREHDGFELLSEPAQTLSLAENEVSVRYFRVKAAKLGSQSLTIFAIGSKMSDAVKRSVEVIPNGLRVERTVNGRLSGNSKTPVVIPDFAVPGASRVMVKVYPGVFSQVLEGLDGLFSMPHGCFEQTTSTTYPNIMLLAYMKKTDTISPEIQMKAEEYINLGYQRLLSFEVPGGGFEWFGNPPAHKVLTAYGLMEFHDMSKVYDIDMSVVTRTQEWLAKEQEPDGSWKPVEHWIETLSGDDFSRSVELNTAYIAWALADTGYKGEAADKAIAYLKSNMKNIKDAYTLALAVNALLAADPDDRAAQEILRQLEGAKIEDETGAHWAPKGETAVNGSGNAAEIETTALIVYAMIKDGSHPATVNKGLSWLSAQKDSFGTFQTTQATILTFKALLAAEAGAPNVNADVNVSMAGRTEKIKIRPENSDVMRVIDFKNETKTGDQEVTIEAPEDLGLAYQIAAIFYVPWNRVAEIEEKPVLTMAVAYDREKLSTNDILTAKVTATYHGKDATDMVILDLGMPPGFELVPDGLNKARENGLIEKYNATGRQITIYVRRMEAEVPLKIEYQLRAKYPVKAKAPKSAAYEYYNPNNRFETRPVELEVTK